MIFHSRIRIKEYFTKSFLDHTAIYSDYRDKLIWRNKAFVIVTDIFTAIADGQESKAVGFWPRDRAKNKFWGGNGDLQLYKKEFIFANVKPTDASLEEKDKQGTVAILEKIHNNEYSRGNFTYLNALRMLAISRNNGSLYSNFSLSRCLNILDVEYLSISARNFIDMNKRFTNFQNELTNGHLEEAFLHFKDNDGKPLASVIASEKIKAHMFLSSREVTNLGQFAFWAIEQKLSLMSGAIHFTYDLEKSDFDYSRAIFFNENFMLATNVPEDTGFVSLMEYMPNTPEKMKLPTSSQRDMNGFTQWRDFLLQQQASQAFSEYFKNGKRFSSKIPPWVECYKRLIQEEKWPYRMIASNYFYNDNRIFAYNHYSRISKYCPCLTYFDDEKEIIMIVNGGKKDFWIYWAQEEIPFAFNDRFAISLDSIMGPYNKKLKIWKRNTAGEWDEKPLYDNEYPSPKEKITELKNFIDLYQNNCINERY